MDFPHLNDTKFPNVGNVDVYAYQNDFDYPRWKPNTKAYLVNVRWNGDYADCVKFESDEVRDDWFDALVANTIEDNPDCAVTLDKLGTNFIQNFIKVPLPYDRAAQFNYLVVDVPVMTSDDNMLNYETRDGYRRWYFFINGFTSLAPSTTTLTIAMDVWTQYINSVGFNYMMLERGHAPVAATDTDEYLKNPIDNCEYLLVPDVDFGRGTVTRGGEFVPFGNGEKYLCFASTCTPAQITGVGSAVYSSDYSFTDPIFSDASDYPDSSNRWGRAYNVSGYGYGSGKSYENCAVPTGNSLTSNGRVPDNVTVYAVPTGDADAFFSDCMRVSPTFFKTVVGFFMVARDLLTLGAVYTVAGHAVYACTGSAKKLADVTLTRDMFGYPEEYQRFAKLYTFPYSELEVTDNNGKSATVRIEDTGSMAANAVVALAYPYLNMRLFLDGIGGVGAESYKWADLRSTSDESISNADWYKYCFDMQIPMYGLYMDGQTSWELNNYATALGNARESALINYHNSAREANNAMGNAQDSANTNRVNSQAAATTQETNADNTANTNQTNTNNDATTLSSNHANARSCATDVTATQNAKANADAASFNTKSTQNILTTNADATAKNGYANNFAHATTKEETHTSVANTAHSSYAELGGVAGQALVAGVSGFLTAGPVGAGLGASLSIASNAGQLAGALVTAHNETVTAQCDTAVTSLQTIYNNSNVTRTVASNNANNSTTIEYNNASTSHLVNAATNTTARQNSCDSANTANTVGTMNTNAANTASMIKTNAANTRSTAHTNAQRLSNTLNTNAEYTDRAALVAAQDILRNTQNGYKARLSDSKRNSPVVLCSASGDPAPDYMRTRGVQIKVRTQSRNAIRCAGDEFVRYGYSLNQIWHVKSLTLMKHFTYWKAKDCWVYDKCQTNDSAQRGIAAIFEQGVTVWSNPEEIGMVNPYDN